MTTDEVFAVIRQQNESIIALLARLVWTPDKLAAVVKSRKSDPEAYVRVYNALDGERTVTSVADIAKVKQQTMSVILQGWLDEGIVLNVGSDSRPKYKRLMKLPERRNQKDAQPQPGASVEELPVTQGTEGNNGNGE
jgi:hypothetical protein